MDRGAFHRPPRSFPPAVPNERVVIAEPPSLGRRGVGSLLQILLPALGTLGIVAFVVVMPSKLFLIVAGAFVLMTVASVVGSYWAQRRSGKLSARTQRRLYRAHLAQREVELAAIARHQREVDERLYPDPVWLAGLVAHRRYLWERRPTDQDFLSFRLGRAAIPLACPLELALSTDPMTEHEPELHAQAQALLERFRAVDDLSVVASLHQASVVTITGDRRAGGRRRPLDARAGGRVSGTRRPPGHGLLRGCPRRGLGVVEVAAARPLGTRSGAAPGRERSIAADGIEPCGALAAARGARPAAARAAAPDRGLGGGRRGVGDGRCA